MNSDDSLGIKEVSLKGYSLVRSSFSIELSIPQGRALALELVAASDLVVENFSPRVMANFHLEWDAVKESVQKKIKHGETE